MTSSRFCHCHRAVRLGALLRADAAPIFIVGPMGSGTTLLRLMLDSHPDIAIARETGIARSLMTVKSIPFRPNGAELWNKRLGYSDDELDERIRDFYAEMFERFAAERGKRRWGDKTPFHLWHMHTLAYFWPNARFIGVVRHPGATMNSTVRRFEWEWPKAAFNWRTQTLELINATQALGNNACMCRYEDLVLDPENVMRSLLTWLDEPWSARVLRHHEVQRSGKKRVEGGTRRTDPIDPARMVRWITEMPAEGRAAMEPLGPLAEFFGYPLDDAERLSSWSEPDAPYRNVMTGNDVAQRKTHWDIDWDEEVPRNFSDRALTNDELQQFVEEIRRDTYASLAETGFVRVALSLRRRLRARLEDSPS